MADLDQHKSLPWNHRPSPQQDHSQVHRKHLPVSHFLCRICIDPLFPAPLGFEPKFQDYLKNTNEENDFELVFDERIDRVKGVGEEILAGTPEEDDDTFDDDGEDFQDWSFNIVTVD